MKNYLLLIVALIGIAGGANAQTYTWRQALDAIRQVETGGCPNEGIGTKGDNGNAWGPYQIWPAYHQDAAERDRTLTSYSKCLTSKAYSERVVRAYMNRYARAELKRLEAGAGSLADVLKVARIHNGGPSGHRRDSTLRYAEKIRKLLVPLDNAAESV